MTSTSPALVTAQSTIPHWHFDMLNDTIRNLVFHQAIQSAVRPGDLVLDIGTGAGLTAMMAAAAGAQVITCEAHPVVAEMARRVIADNGVSDRITVLGKLSTDLRIGHDLPRPVDVLIAEVFDCGLLGEGALHTFAHAAGLLKPGAKTIPARGTLYCQLLESDSLWGLNHVESALGFDLSAFNDLSTAGYFPARRTQHTWRPLAMPVALACIDFDTPQPTLSLDRATTITDAGVLHGAALWFELEFDTGSARLGNPPGQPSHWHQALQTRRPAYPVQPGDTVDLSAHSDGDKLTLDIRLRSAAWATPPAPHPDSVSSTPTLAQ
ncbi:50S ribosomal protein L11 methyltransferase [Nocardia sp. 2]|uniref:50S ribosomal protein L11 methyltransferase n=1 Tax=Nocardia acididurans TaxID=2802282 RepID=A0ABS1M8M1_9NOCA|nr:50S ribosomal protein L11 methyltransferase [Nocardia acididurans]MBL1076380.1 50S ribosomal protein L11 methyltransferase [Nocardia acididurans]